MNLKEQYFNELKNSSQLVAIFIKDQINLQNDIFSFDDKLFKFYKDFYEKRTGKAIFFRSFLTKLSHDILSQESLDVSIMSLSEISNYHPYLDNWIFDNKSNTWDSPERVCYITLISAVYRELFEQVVTSINISNEKKDRINYTFSKATTFSYLGQSLDLQLSISELENFINDEDLFYEMYIKKIKLQSGFLYGASMELGAIVANNELYRERMKELGELIGTGLHLSNDLGDFAILESDSSFKTYQDQFSDLINGRLTLPIFYMLKYSSKEDREFVVSCVGNKDYSKDKLLSIFYSSGAYKKTKQKIRYFYNLSKKKVNELPETPSRPLLKYACTVMRNNKYLHKLHIDSKNLY